MLFSNKKMGTSICHSFSVQSLLVFLKCTGNLQHKRHQLTTQNHLGHPALHGLLTMQGAGQANEK